MWNKFSSDDFFRKAKEIWKDEYDYSKVVYKDYDTEVTIICKKDDHPEFNKKPKYHLKQKSPSGCPICGRLKQIEKATKPFEDFLNDARKIHGDLYEYLKESYKNSKIDIQIICKIHGPFPQSPDVHINHRAGCPKCRDELTGERSKLKFDEVNLRLNENSKGNDTTVSFDEKEYLGVNANLKIKCSKHGIQEPRLVNTMFEGTHPCIECTAEILGRNIKRRTKEDVFQFLNERFDGKYKIYDFEYGDKRTVITLNCSFEGHGDFSFQVDSMYTSNGCPVCSYENSIEKRTASVRKHNESTRKSRELKWLERVKIKHGDLYDYSLVYYVNALTPVIIICRNHGNTLQVPDTHLNHGCRLCADELNAKRLTKTLKQFIDEAKHVHADTYRYDHVDYKSTTEKVLITCKLHGDFPQTPDSHLQGAGCPRCFNKNEGRLAVILNERGIVHRQYKIENKRYDFLLPEFNIIIERDGEQHYRGIDFGGKDKIENLISQQNNDRYKTNLAKSKGYKIFRIPYWLSEEDERKEIQNILDGTPTYPDVPDIEQAKTKPLPN